MKNGKVTLPGEAYVEQPQNINFAYFKVAKSEVCIYTGNSENVKYLETTIS